jgi:folate-binding protein YgfZ|tara:strand:- start:2034 stop:2825 length:792 start_codon:yes stop_codon:yes gene_type:complete
VVAVVGPDARTYLQGQLSQDVEALEVGGSAETFLLQPAGKVDAWMRVSRLADDHFLLDVEEGFGPQVVARLTRFLLRTDCTVQEVQWDLLTVIDAEASAFSPPVGGLALAVEWPGLVAVDLLGPSVELPAGLAEGSSRDWEARRIAAGIPAMGSEMDSTTIPGSTGVVERSASFTKGCYTGQELVARVNSRSAGTPTRIVRAVGSGPAPAVGSDVTVDSDPAGHLTSVATLGDGFVALVSVRRAVATPAEAMAGATPVSLLGV